MGSYLCVVRHPGRAEVRYPVCIGRGEHWDGVAPRARSAPAHPPKDRFSRRPRVPSPPAGGTDGDYVRPPRQTIEERAGDCDDLTVLTISLASAIGVPGYMAFLPGHVYPILCPKSGKELPNAIPIDGQSCYAAEVTDKGSKLAVEKDLSELEAVFDPVRNQEVRVGR